MARQRRKGRPCKFETLETRYLLAGDVTARIFNGDLIIKGDDLANGITITAGATAGTVVIKGVNAGGSATNVANITNGPATGTPNGTVTLTGFTGDLKISMKDGDDTVSITDLTIPGEAKIKGGDGNDTFTIDGLTVHDKLKINLGDGDDTLSIADTDVTGKTRIKGKSGDDDVTIDGSTFTKLRTSLGRGDDTLDISDTTVSIKTRLNGRSGTNTFTNGTGNSLANLKEKNFGDDDDDDSETSPSETSPTLAISGAASVNEGSLYTLNLSSTGTGASTISKWTITWGDGSAAQEVTGNPSSVTHTYTDGAATRTISATATNAGGTTNAGNTVSVTVNNVAPTLSIRGDASVNEGSLYTLNLLSTDLGNDTISKWTINWGDGSAVQTVTGDPASVTHIFTDGPATRTISATATDEDGTFNAGGTVAVTVGNVAPTLAISGAASVDEGSLYTLNLSSTDPGTDTISQWVINWGDGSAAQTVTGNPSSVTHTFTDGPATRTISATATDEDGTFNAGNTVTVTVNNVAPALAIGGATSVNEGALYTLNLSSTGPGADTISQWTINWGDDTPTQVVTGNPSSVTHTYTDGAGIRTILATATDEDSTYAAGNTLAVIVGNVSPTLAISGAASVNEGAVYTLNFSPTDPGADTISQWSINWGDGTPLQTVIGDPASVTHTFADGTFTRTISATATDEDGTFNAGNTVQVTVNNIAPTPSISGASSIDEGSLYTLNLSSIDPGADTISQWSINWGDGTPVQVVNGNPASVTHTFADGPNTCTISATATDEDGTFAAGNTVTVTIQNVAPTISFFGPSVVNEGSGNYWTLGAPFDPGTDDIAQVIVNWGDGTDQSFPLGQVSGPDGLFHIYEEGSNTYTITIDLVDEDGMYLSVATQEVIVNNVTPGISLSSINPAYENTPATLYGQYSDSGIFDGQTLTINWGDPNDSAESTFELPARLVLNVGNTFSSTTDGAVLTITLLLGDIVGFTVDHTYADDGLAPGDGLDFNASNITVTITDDDGDSNSASTIAVVHDLGAILDAEPFANVNENEFLTFNGTYTDIGLLDAQTLSFNWGDPSNNAISTFQLPAIQDVSGTPILSVGQVFNSTSDNAVLTITSIDNLTGKVTFSTQHQYLDDGAPNDGYNVYFPYVAATITGDDTPSQTIYRYAAIYDQAPTLSVDPVSDVSEGDTLALTGTYTDAGLLDSQTMTIDWGDFNSPISYFYIRAIQDAAGSPTLNVGDIFLSTFEGTLLTIKSVDATTGQVGFSVLHHYSDDGYSVFGNGTASDGANIFVTVTDDDGQVAGSTSPFTIHNVAPTVSLDPIGSISEGSATITGTFTDVGLFDLHTLNVNWGDSNNTMPSTFAIRSISDFYGLPLTVGSSYYSYSDSAFLMITSIDANTGAVGFSINRQYPDDGAAPGNGTSSDLATIDLTVSDDDGESGTARRFVTINNVAPAVSLDSVNGITENGFATLTGSFTDPGILDTHTLTINWGDLNSSADTTFNLPSTAYLLYGSYASTDFSSYLTITSIDSLTGQVYFSVQHQYRDDGLAPGNATEGDISAISVTIADDDGQSGASTRFVTVSNTSPTIALNPSFYVVPVGSTATLLGSYSDGPLDAQSLVITWGDSSADSTFAIPGILNGAGANMVNVGGTFSSSTDGAVLTVVWIDHSIGQVGFSVQHQYAITGLMTVNANIADDDLAGASGGATFFVTPIID